MTIIDNLVDIKTNYTYPVYNGWSDKFLRYDFTKDKILSVHTANLHILRFTINTTFVAQKEYFEEAKECAKKQVHHYLYSDIINSLESIMIRSYRIGDQDLIREIKELLNKLY